MFKPRDVREGEQVFALLGDDPLTPLFAEAYGYLIQGQLSMAQEAITKMSTIIEPLPAYDPKVRSCFAFANDCRDRQKLLAISGDVSRETS